MPSGSTYPDVDRFEPVRFLNPRTGRHHVLVDGGLLSNFPVWLFDDESAWGVPTIGIRLDEGSEVLSDSTGGMLAMIDFVRSLAQTVLSAHDRHYLERTRFDRTISVPCLGVRTAEFDLSAERACALYEAGRAAAEAFLNGGALGEGRETVMSEVGSAPSARRAVSTPAHDLVLSAPV